VNDEEARSALREAMRLHAAGDIDGALEAARAVLTEVPGYGEAWCYVGNTLVTRKRQFADGIAALEYATILRPADAAIWYTLGWCREYAANALARPKGGRPEPHQPLADTATTLYAKAKEAMLHALTLDPEEGMRGDIEDILDVIANVTGEPWTDEPR
jgi:tetratricopeptide (TPR) repeat protein